MAYASHDPKVNQRAQWYHQLWETGQRISYLDPNARIVFADLLRLIAATAGLADSSIESWQASTWGKPAPGTRPLGRDGRS